MFRSHGLFSLREAGGAFFFVKEGGRRQGREEGGARGEHAILEVRTDALGKAIWESLPGERGEVARRAAARIAEGLTTDVGEIGQTGVGEVIGEGGESGGGSGGEGAEKPRIEGLIDVFLTVLVKAGIVATDEGEDGGAAREAGGKPGELEIEESRSNGKAGSDRGDGADLVSIVVVTHDGAAHVRDCFGSLTSQSHRNIEIIAVDSGSTDRTPDLIRKEYPGVHLVSLAKNIHFARAVNAGIEQASGRHIFILNQDVEVERVCVARLAARFGAESGRGGKIGAVVPMMKFFGLRGFINGIGNHIRRRGWGSDNFIGFVDIGQFRDLEDVPSACFGAVMLDREAIADVGLLDEKYTAFYEDVDWSFRCWMRGWRIVPESRAVVFHKFGASYPWKGKLRLVVRNRLRLVLKLFRGRKRWGFLARYVGEDIRNFLSLFGRGKWGQARGYIAAYASLFRQMPGILLKRRKFFASLRRARRSGAGRRCGPTPPRPFRESGILAKNPVVFSALDPDGRPILDSRLVESYYMKLRDRSTIPRF